MHTISGFWQLNLEREVAASVSAEMAACRLSILGCFSIHRIHLDYCYIL